MRRGLWLAVLASGGGAIAVSVLPDGSDEAGVVVAAAVRAPVVAAPHGLTLGGDVGPPQGGHALDCSA